MIGPVVSEFTPDIEIPQEFYIYRDMSTYDDPKVTESAFLLHKVSSGRFDGLCKLKIVQEYLQNLTEGFDLLRPLWPLFGLLV